MRIHILCKSYCEVYAHKLHMRFYVIYEILLQKLLMISSFKPYLASCTKNLGQCSIRPTITISPNSNMASLDAKKME